MILPKGKRFSGLHREGMITLKVTISLQYAFTPFVAPTLWVKQPPSSTRCSNRLVICDS